MVARKVAVAGAVAALAAVLLAAGVAGWTIFGAAGTAGGMDPDDPALVALGARVYADHCAACHGADLEGQPRWRERLASGRLPAPPHDASGHTWHHPGRQLFDITKQGTAAFAPPGYETDMIGFGDLLSDREIWAVLSFIKSTWPPEIRARHDAIEREVPR